MQNDLKPEYTHLAQRSARFTPREVRDQLLRIQTWCDETRGLGTPVWEVPRARTIDREEEHYSKQSDCEPSLAENFVDHLGTKEESGNHDLMEE